MHTLIPNAALLSKHLAIFAEACSATEVILFERTTFLVIATSVDLSAEEKTRTTPMSDLSLSINGSPGAIERYRMDPTRYERTSELIKIFKHACARMREEFHSLEMELPEFTAVLDGLTKNTYIMVIVHDPTVGESLNNRSNMPSLIHDILPETAAININIRLARPKFEELQAHTLT